MAAVGQLKQRVVTVTTAGTKVNLFTAPYPKVTSILFRAAAANGGFIYIGNASVVVASDLGIKLAADEKTGMDGDNGNAGGSMLLETDNLYADTTSSGDKVIISYIEVT